VSGLLGRVGLFSLPGPRNPQVYYRVWTFTLPLNRSCLSEAFPLHGGWCRTWQALHPKASRPRECGASSALCRRERRAAPASSPRSTTRSTACACRVRRVGLLLLAACNMSSDTVINNFNWAATSLTRPEAAWSWSQDIIASFAWTSSRHQRSQTGWRRFGER
jgi:hypothetical protein